MKINVSCIHWFLHFISIVSSCLLFILVASEGVKSSSLTASINLQDNAQEINISEGGQPGRDTPDTTAEAADTQGADIRSSFEEVPQKPDSSDAHYEFALSQNSGLSDGFSDTDQAVVFTLVDTATAELQQRAELPATHATHSGTEERDRERNSSGHNQVNFTPTVLVQPAPLTENHTEESSSPTVISGGNIPAPPAEASSNEDYIVHAEPKVIGKEAGKEVGKEAGSEPESVNQTETVDNSATPDPKVNASVDDKDAIKEDHEDIPSFSEWTQKQLEEAEKKKEKVNTSSHSHQINKPTSNLKLRSKNYASPDCGAKIVAANPEAISAGSVLSPSRDEYKLNTCTSRIWFVVELCEAIQAKKIDLANFELFSSSPKDFTVSVSDRFPSRDWSSVGQFQAKDERDIQSFNLHPHLFGKFIKVEMLSHWGSEHFCPISLFRVYGTSEFEVLETEDQVIENVSDDDDDDETLDSYKGESTNNLFGSARDAVMSIVKKAAEVLVKSGDGSNRTDQDQLNYSVKYSPLINTCSTPSHIVVCDNCSDILFGQVYELLSCKSDYLQKLINIPLVSKSLYNTDICVEYGLNFYSKSVDSSTDSQCNYISTFFPPKYIAAVCNVLAILENKVVLNISSQYSNTSSTINTTLTDNLINLDDKPSVEIEPTSCPTDETIEAKTCATRTKPADHQEEAKPTVINEDSFSDTPIEMQIKPTKTFSKDRKVDPSFSETTEESSIVSTRKVVTLDPSESVQLPQSVETATVENKMRNKTDDDSSSSRIGTVDTTSSTVSEASFPATDSSENYEIAHDQLDKLLSELNLDSDGGHTASTTTVAPPSSVPQQAQKESVFLRLSNRIKALERNMSLSGQYLEELSRRYKKQVEEMQRVFEKKLALITEENKKHEERELRLQEKLERLTVSVESLLNERDSLWKTASLLGQFLLMEVFVTCILLYFCWKSPENGTTASSQNSKKSGAVQVKRRKSIDTVGHESPVVHRRRRPSEEALRISGTYQDLLITDEVDGVNGALTKAERRRRRKKNALLRSQSVVACKDMLPPASDEPTRRASSSDMTRKPNSLPVSTPQVMCINGDITPPPAKIQEVPFVLEDSEHSSVEPLDYFSDAIKPRNSAPETVSPNYSMLKSMKISKNGSLKSSILKSHSPLFMKTALSSRSKRNSTAKRLSLFKTDKFGGPEKLLENSSHRKSPEPSIQSNSFSVSDSQDDQTSLNSDTSKKDSKKSGGFKRIFKKVFD